MDEIINAMLAVINIYEIHEDRSRFEDRNMMKARPSDQQRDYIRAAEGLAPEAKWGIVARGASAYSLSDLPIALLSISEMGFHHRIGPGWQWRHSDISGGPHYRVVFWGQLAVISVWMMGCCDL